MRKDHCKTKVVASLGPALCSEADIAEAISLGADFRQPFGYRVQDHFGQFALVNRLRGEMQAQTEVYVDLPSERPRIGVVEGELQFASGQKVVIRAVAQTAAARTDKPDEIPIPDLKRFLPVLQAGHRVLIRDGHTVLRVTEIAADCAFAIVEQSVEGVASNNNIMFPDSAIVFQPIVEADRALLEGYREAGFAPDWVMLSLISTVQQVDEARRELAAIFAERAPRVMVKIETAKSVERMAELLEVADGLLVGRGDLGMTIAPETIPAVQEDVVNACHRAGKRVLVATEFLQRFAETGVVNRAELSDVALAARQGVDGIVLTKETSGSPHALDSIRLANSIVEVERQRTTRSDDRAIGRSDD